MPSLLICDTEQALVDELAEWFRTEGWSVDVADSVARVNKAMTENGYPDVLLIEQELPFQAGSDLACTLLDAAGASRPCIVALMGSDDFGAATSEPRHCDLWLGKPFSPRSACDRFEFAMRRSPICAERRRGQNPSSSRVDC